MIRKVFVFVFVFVCKKTPDLCSCVCLFYDAPCALRPLPRTHSLAGRRYLRDPRVLVAECFAFVWGVSTPMIVVDIDGTITRSDVPGLLMTLRPGLIADQTHAGICPLLARMVDEEVSE